MLFEVCLICVHHAVEPWQELLGAVIGVQYDRDTISRGNGADVMCSGNCTCDTGLLVLVGDTLAWTSVDSSI